MAFDFACVYVLYLSHVMCLRTMCGESGSCVSGLCLCDCVCLCVFVRVCVVCLSFKSGVCLVMVCMDCVRRLCLCVKNVCVWLSVSCVCDM